MMPRTIQDEDLTFPTRRGPYNADIERRQRLEDDDVGEHHDLHNFASIGINHAEDAETHQQERLESEQRGMIVPMRTANKVLEQVTDFAAAASASSRFQDELLLLSPPTSGVFSLSPPSDSSQLPSFSPGTGSTNRSNHHRSSRPLLGSSSKEIPLNDDSWTASHYSSGGHPPQHAEIDPTLLNEQRPPKPMPSAPEALLQLVELSSLSDDDRSHHGQAFLNHPQSYFQTDTAKTNQHPIDLMYRSANFEKASSAAKISIRTATTMRKRSRDEASSMAESAPTAATIRRISQQHDILNQEATKNFLGKEATSSRSSSPGGSSGEDGTSKVMQEIEHSYAGFDPFPSSASLSELADNHAVHNASAATTYTKKGEEAHHDPLVYEIQENKAAEGTEPSPGTKVAASPPTHEEEPGPARFQGVRRTRTTKRAARQLGSKKGHDDHVIASSGGMEVVQQDTLKVDKKDDGGSEEIEGRHVTRKTAPQNVDQWNTRLQELQEYKAQYGHCNVPFCYNDKPFLAAWVKRQRYQYKCKVRGKHSHLTDERESLLEQLGFVWDTHVAAWEENFALMVEFYRQHGHCYVPIKQKELSTWAKRQRRHYKQYQQRRQQESSLQGPTGTIMTEDRIRRLNEIEFPWTTTARPSSSKVASLHKAASSFGNSSSSATSQEEDQLASQSAPTSTTNGNAITPADSEEPLRTVPVETTNDMAETMRTSSPLSQTVTRPVRRSVRQRSRGYDLRELK